MVKIVSNKKGYTSFFEKNDEDINCVVYETGKHMTGQEIANHLEVTRSAVSQSLKRSIKKMYRSLKNEGYSSTEILFSMVKLFNIKTNIQFKKFFRLLPERIRKENRDIILSIV